MSPQANSIRITKAKQILKQKAEERPTTSNDFSLINLVLFLELNISISTRHCMLPIGIISKGNSYEWTLITIFDISNIMQFDVILHEVNIFCTKIKHAQ